MSPRRWTTDQHWVQNPCAHCIEPVLKAAAQIGFVSSNWVKLNERFWKWYPNHWLSECHVLCSSGMSCSTWAWWLQLRHLAHCTWSLHFRYSVRADGEWAYGWYRAARAWEISQAYKVFMLRSSWTFGLTWAGRLWPSRFAHCKRSFCFRYSVRALGLWQ